MSLLAEVSGITDILSRVRSLHGVHRAPRVAPNVRRTTGIRCLADYSSERTQGHARQAIAPEAIGQIVDRLIVKARAEAGAGPGRLRFLIVAAVLLAVVGSAITADHVVADAPTGDGGSVVAWGANDDGQLNVPDGLDHVVAVAAGDWGTALALRSDGTVVSWGRGANGMARVPAGLSDVTAISAGEDFFLALKKNGEVVAWGGGSSETVATQAVAIAAANAWGIALERDGSIVPVGRINQISYQAQDAVALSTGVGYAIGRNGDPLVLDGGPAPWPAGLHGVTAISGAMALKTDGSIVSWGADGVGQQNVPRSFDIKAIAAGYGFGLALRADGTVVGWGDNRYGQLNIPEGLSGVTAIAAGQTFAMAVTDAPPHGLPRSRLLLVGFEAVGTLLFLGGLAWLLAATRRGWLAGTFLERLTGPWMPTAIAVALAILSMPLVAATFDPSDGTDALAPATPLAIWSAAAGAVLVSALVASRYGARRVRARPVFGTVQTFVVALLVAIPMAPLLPFLLGQQIAFGQYCFFTCGHTYYGTQFLPGALATDLLLPFAPFAEPGPVALLAIGVVIWAVIVRHWPDSLGAQQDTPSHAQSGQDMGTGKVTVGS